MTTVNIFYSPELEAPPMDPECNITFSFITGTPDGDETKRYTFTQGLNRDIPLEDWEKIAEKEITQRMLGTSALRIADPDEMEPEVLKPEQLSGVLDLNAVKLDDLTIKDATETVSRIHDVRILEALKEKEMRTPVRSAIARRISTLGS